MVNRPIQQRFIKRSATGKTLFIFGCTKDILIVCLVHYWEALDSWLTDKRPQASLSFLRSLYTRNENWFRQEERRKLIDRVLARLCCPSARKWTGRGKSRSFASSDQREEKVPRDWPALFVREYCWWSDNFYVDRPPLTTNLPWGSSLFVRVVWLIQSKLLCRKQGTFVDSLAFVLRLSPKRF